MAVQITLHRLAVREYQSARRWYGSRSLRLADRFRAAVDSGLQKIAEGPLKWPVFAGPYRWVKVPRFPYLLYYEIVNGDEVLVVAVAHERRRQGYWRRRRQS